MAMWSRYFPTTSHTNKVSSYAIYTVNAAETGNAANQHAGTDSSYTDKRGAYFLMIMQSETYRALYNWTALASTPLEDELAY